MFSLQPNTKYSSYGGNKIAEAYTEEISDRNASEGIEPRNYPYQRGWQSSYNWKAS